MQNTSAEAEAFGMAVATAPPPREPTITIVSSDGEVVCISPSAAVHSQLLEKAVRRWADVFLGQGHHDAESSSSSEPLGSLTDGDDAAAAGDDATTDELAAADMEETPDENYIKHFYDGAGSGASAVVAGAADGVTSSGTGGSGLGSSPVLEAHGLHSGTAGGDDTGGNFSSHVIRMVSVPAAGEEEEEENKDVGESSKFRQVKAPADTLEPRNDRLSETGAAMPPLTGDHRDSDSDRTASMLPSSVEGSLSNASTPLKSHSINGSPIRGVPAANGVTEVVAAPRSLTVPQAERLAPVSSGSRDAHAAVALTMDADESTPSELSDDVPDEGDATVASAPLVHHATVSSHAEDTRVTFPSATAAMNEIGTASTTTVRGGRTGRDLTPAEALPQSCHVATLRLGRLSNRRHSSVVLQAAEADVGEEEESSTALIPAAVFFAGTAETLSDEFMHSSSEGRSSSPPPPHGWPSPGSCHQRTPCLADEDAIEAIMEDEVPGYTSPMSTPPPSVLSPPPSLDDAASAVVMRAHPSLPTTDSLALPTVTAPQSGEPVISNAVDVATPEEGTADSVLYTDGVRITPTAIVFDLLHPLPSPSPPVPSISPADSATPSPSTPPTVMLREGSAEAATAAGGVSVSIQASILRLCIRFMVHLAEVEAQATAAKAKHRHHRHRMRKGEVGGRDSRSCGDGTATSSCASSSSSSTLAGNSLDSDDDDRTSDASDTSFHVLPTTATAANLKSGSALPSSSLEPPDASASSPRVHAYLPEPLSAPLVTFLRPWTRTFLYEDILRAPATLSAALAILDVCPDMDYTHPNEYLRDANVKAALLVPAPPSEGVHRLMEVMMAAKQLRIDTLHALCGGWLADFMIRVSYGAKDNFEAAHLIRHCLRVHNDWSRREADCLKVENEWPVSEEAE